MSATETETVIIPRLSSPNAPWNECPLGNMALWAGIPTGEPIPALAYDWLRAALHLRNMPGEPLEPICTYLARVQVAEEDHSAACGFAITTARNLCDEFQHRGRIG